MRRFAAMFPVRMYLVMNAVYTSLSNILPYRCRTILVGSLSTVSEMLRITIQASGIHDSGTLLLTTCRIIIGLWANFLQDTDAALYDIYEACARAGPNDPCPLKEDNAELIATRVSNLLAKTKEEPVPVYLPQLGEYGIVDYALVREQILQSLYVTHNGGGRTLMLLLAELEKGDGSHIYQRSSRRMLENLVKCNCSAPPEQQRALSGMALTNAIACGDASETHMNLAEARAFYDELSRDTTFTDVWSMPLICA